jgi:hypothetical protein
MSVQLRVQKLRSFDLLHFFNKPVNFSSFSD